MKDKTILNALSREILEHRSKNLDEILDEISVEATKLLAADRCTLYVYDLLKDELWSKIAQKLEIDEIRLKIGQGIAGHVAKTKKLLNIKDAYDTPYFNPGIDKSTGYRTKTLLVSPILNHENELIGVIEILNKKRGTFTSKDEELIETFSNVCAISIEQAQLYQWHKVIMRYNENIIRNISSGLVATDNEFKVNLINRTAKIIFKTIGININNKILPKALSFFKIPNEFFENLKVHGIAKFDKLEVSFKGITMYFNIKGSSLQEENSESYGYIFLFDDITEKTLLEIEKKQEEATKLIGRMASSIIHDIKNPLTIIKSYVQLIEKTLLNKEGDIKDTGRHYYNIVSSEIDRLVSMTDEVLEFVQGEYKINIEECNIEKLVKDIKYHIEELGKDKGIDFEISLGYKGNINIDKDKIKRLFYNISYNATDAIIKDDGKISLSISKEDSYLKIIFKDNGIGMPKNIQKTILRPFVSHNKSKGIGLGMAIVKKIVDEHRGTITINSEVNIGTEIIILIPFNLNNST